MKANPQLIFKPVDDLVNQLGGISQFGTRITASRKGRSHEGAAFVVTTVDDFS